MKDIKEKRKKIEFKLSYVYLDYDFFSCNVSELQKKIAEFRGLIEKNFQDLDKEYWLCSVDESPLNPKNYEDFRIQIENDGYSGYEIEVFGIRDENDNEYSERIEKLLKRRKANMEATKKRQAIALEKRLLKKQIEEARERELLKKLKRKYETDEQKENKSS